MRRRELLLLLSASMALAACGSLANLMAPKPWRTALIADSAPLPNAPRPVMPMTAAHSHNDYEQRRPLLDALALGYRSVEADIWLRDSELWVSHKGRSLAGTLRELYLDPLQDRVDRLGSVHGDGEPFLLWLDLKSGEEELVLELRHLLARYPMLARMDGGKMKRAAVTVILTGDENGKRAYTAGAGARYACRDSNELLEDEKRDPLHLWYALSWPDWFSPRPRRPGVAARDGSRRGRCPQGGRGAARALHRSACPRLEQPAERDSLDSRRHLATRSIARDRVQGDRPHRLERRARFADDRTAARFHPEPARRWPADPPRRGRPGADLSPGA